LPGSVPWGETMATGDHDPFSGESVRGGASEICVSEARARAVPLRRTACTYLACAALNPYHVIMLAGALLLCLISWSFWALLVELGADLLVLAILPWCGFFRRRADAHLDQAARIEAAREREALIQRMGEGHRHELSRLDALVERTRDPRLRGGRELPEIAGEGGGLDRLAYRYIRLAIAHRVCAETLAMTDYRALQATIRSLEATLPAPAPRIRRVMERRLSVAKKRVEHWGRARENLEFLTHELSTIVELVQLVHERTTAPASGQRFCTDVDGLLTELDDSEGIERELADLGTDDNLELIEELEATPVMALCRR
jgi:hypothetical protein